ncbi:MAG TPA: NADP-dependent oxidoreductase [Microbacterium sp.]|nr:NADP-dependent oxidoreductase [Microbacterium sp.]
MRTYALAQAGAAPAFADADIPDPAPGEARIRIAAASVNGFDLAVAAGYMTGFFDHLYPVVLGREFAGVVDAVADDVSDLAVGDRVLGVVSKPHLHEGAFAEYTTVPTGDCVIAPAALTMPEAASLAHTGSAALAILAALGSDLRGRTVLIVGATGGVGTLLVQLASAEGATVIATGRTAEGRALLVELGAAHAVDYTEDLAADVRAVAVDGVDAAVHLHGDPDEIAPLVHQGGRFISPLLYSPEQFGKPWVEFVPIAAYPTPAGLHRLAELVEAGRLRVIVDREFAWEDTPNAFAAFGRETLGNLVVRVGE